MVHKSEREDFRNSIKSVGLDPSDFELIEKEDLPSGTIYRLTGTVTIRRRSNKREKTYRAGHGSSWPAEFDCDLKKKVFG